MENTSKPPAVTFERTEDFKATYSNSVRFESTVHDLTIIFGKIDQGSGHEVVKQYTSVTIPWSLVKLAEYYLDVNLLIHESSNGKIRIPPSQIPPLPAEPDEDIKSNPSVIETLDLIKKLREEFVAKNF